MKTVLGLTRLSVRKGLCNEDKHGKVDIARDCGHVV
jgi:hypothetical protein